MSKVKVFFIVLLLCACSAGAWAQYYADMSRFEGKIRIKRASNPNEYLYEDGLSEHSYIPGYEKQITYLGLEDKIFCQYLLFEDPVVNKHHETHDYIFTLKKEGEGPNGEPMYSIYSDGTEYLDYSGGYLTDATSLAFTEEGFIVPETGINYTWDMRPRYTFTKEKMGDYSLFLFEVVNEFRGELMIKTVAGGGYIGISGEVPIVQGDGTSFIVEQVTDDDPEGGNPNSVEAVAGAGIWTSGSTLHINVPLPVAVYIYNVNGALVKTLAAGAVSTTLPQGVYIVKVGEAAQKVVIR